jgi:membrane fusion protein, multidrug efflux system
MTLITKRIRFKSPVVALWIGAVLLITTGCDPATTAKSIALPERVRPVRTVQLQQQPLQWTRTFPGTAKALQNTDLSFRVGGPLVVLKTTTGQRVDKGAVIARVDPRDFLVRVRTATAKLEEAKLQFHRYTALIKEKASAKARYDQVKATYEMALAQVTADAKQEENARNAVNDTILQAPFTGYIHQEYVENHETVSIGQPVVSMVDLSQIEIEVPLPEDFLPQTHRFLSFSCRFDALPQQEFPATFKEIAKQPDPSSGTYPMTLLLDQTTLDITALVRPGMAIEVSISISNESNAQCFLVPVGAVVNDHTYQSFVWCIDKQKERVLRQPVTIDAITESGITIKGDMMPGQLIVSAGAHYLTDRQRVRVLKKASITNIGAEL